LQASAFLLQVAAARFRGLQSVRLGPGRFDEALVKHARDRFLADRDLPLLADERGDDIGARCQPECFALLLLDRRLSGEVVDPEFGQALPDAA
jgi:hypothetical protein